MLYTDLADAADSMINHPEQLDGEVFIMNVAKDYKVKDGFRLGKRAYDVNKNILEYSIPMFKKRKDDV